jgi:hypothetical protein
MSRDRWAIRVTYATGEDAWLRHGGVPGEGPVVKFTSRQVAEREASFVREGLDVADVVAVVRFHRGRVQPQPAPAVREDVTPPVVPLREKTLSSSSAPEKP